MSRSGKRLKKLFLEDIPQRVQEAAQQAGDFLIHELPEKVSDSYDSAKQAIQYFPDNAREWGARVWENQGIGERGGDVREAGERLAEDPELYELAYAAAQARMPWQGDAKEFDKRRFNLKDFVTAGRSENTFKSAYEKAWHESALWILGTAALGDEPIRERLERERGFNELERQPDLREENRRKTVMELSSMRINLPNDPTLPDLRLSRADYQRIYGRSNRPEVDKGVGEIELLIQTEITDEFVLLEGLNLLEVANYLQEVRVRAANPEIQDRALTLAAWLNTEYAGLPATPPREEVTWKKFKRDRINDAFAQRFGQDKSALAILEEKFLDIVTKTRRLNERRAARPRTDRPTMPALEQARLLNEEMEIFTTRLTQLALQWETMDRARGGEAIRGLFNIEQVRKIQFENTEHEDGMVLVERESKAKAEIKSHLLTVANRFVSEALARSRTDIKNQESLVRYEEVAGESEARETIAYDTERWASGHEKWKKQWKWVSWATDVDQVIAEERGGSKSLEVKKGSEGLLADIEKKIKDEVKSTARIVVGTLRATHDRLLPLGPGGQPDNLRYRAKVSFRPDKFAPGLNAEDAAENARNNTQPVHSIVITEAQTWMLLELAQGQDVTANPEYASLVASVGSSLESEIADARLEAIKAPFFSATEFDDMVTEAIRDLAYQIKVQEELGDERDPSYEVDPANPEPLQKWDARRLNDYTLEASKFMARMKESLTRQHAGASINATGMISEAIPWQDGSVFKSRVVNGVLEAKSENRKRFEARLFQLLNEMEERAQAEAAQLKGLAGIVDAKVIWGAVVCTFDSRQITRESIKAKIGARPRGLHLGRSLEALGSILIDINPGRYPNAAAPTYDNTLRHELQHQFVLLNDLLLSRDSRLGLNGANRRWGYTTIFDVNSEFASPGGGTPSQEDPIKNDGEVMKHLLGRDFNQAKDPARIRRQLAWLDELSARMFTPGDDFDALDLRKDFGTAFGTGKHSELVGDDTTDKDRAARIIGYLQGLRSFENYLAAQGVPDAALDEEFFPIYSILGTARTVAQAETLLALAWNKLKTTYPTELLPNAAYWTRLHADGGNGSGYPDIDTLLNRGNGPTTPPGGGRGRRRP